MNTSNTPRQNETTTGDEVPGYGRARLWLGITGVGTIVTLSSAALFLKLPERLLPPATAPLNVQVKGLLFFIVLYVLIQLPLDFLGGYFLPQRYRRQHPPFHHFLASLLRGVGVHSIVLLLIALSLLGAARVAGVVGVVLAGTLLGPRMTRG